MKKVVFLFIVLVLLLSACNSAEKYPVPYAQLSFELEPNPRYLGSYTMSRSNYHSTWSEWGEWKSSAELFLSGSKVCFAYFYKEDHGVFKARSDYEWVECQRGKETCLCLAKRKE